MNKFKFYTLALLLGTSLQTVCYFAGDKIWHGTIKFPANSKNILPVRIYYAGNIVPSEVQSNSKQVSFDISESKIRNNFCLIIVDNIELITEQNTIKCLKAPEGRPYKLYQMEFAPSKDTAKASDANLDASHMGSWSVTQKMLPENRHIPDNAIIVCYHPNLVKDVEGGNGLELPKIILDERIMTQLTDDELQDASVQYLLTSLNCDSIHARQQALIKPDFAKKTVISMIYS